MNRCTGKSKIVYKKGYLNIIELKDTWNLRFKLLQLTCNKSNLMFKIYFALDILKLKGLSIDYYIFEGVIMFSIFTCFFS